jgi:hypothetical protein
MAFQPIVLNRLMLKQLGTNPNLAISFPMVDGDEDNTAATSASRTGLYGVATTSINFVVNAVDAFKVTATNAYVGGTNAVWHAGNLTPSQYQLVSGLGVANGYASLDNTGKVPVAQLPAVLVNGLSYQSAWNASTNSPTLVSGVGTTGQFYRVSAAGTTLLDSVSNWNVGDLAWFSGSQWLRILGGTTLMVVNPMNAGAPVNLTSSSTTAVDSFPDDSAAGYHWSLIVGNGSTLSQYYDVIATRISSSGPTFSVDFSHNVGNNSAAVSGICVQVIGGALQLRVTLNAVSGMVARVQRWQSL